VDEAVRSAYHWLLFDARGIALLTVAACAVVVAAMMAAGYLVFALLGTLAEGVRRLRG